MAVISPIRRKLDAVLAPNATLYSLNLCGFLLQGCTEVTGSGCSAADQVHLSKKEKKFFSRTSNGSLVSGCAQNGARMQHLCDI